MLLFLLPSCAKKDNHHIPHLKPLTSYIDYAESRDDITLRVKKLTEHDCKPLFGNRTRLLFKKRNKRPPIYPIQLSITNKTNHRITLKPEDIGLILTDYKTVAKRIEHNTFLHALGGIVLGLLITGGLAAGSALAVMSGSIFTMLFGNALAAISAPLLITGVSVCLVTPFFLIVGTPIISAARGIETSKENLIMKRELVDKSFKRCLIVDSGQTVDTLIFVSKPDLKPSFMISIGPKEKQPITFHVTLHEEEPLDR